MAKKKFDLSYIGIKKDIYPIIYHNRGDYSVIIKCNNPINQFSGDEGLYYTYHGVFTNILKNLGSGYTIQKHDIFSNYEYKASDSNEFLTEKYFEHFEDRVYKNITTYLTITKNTTRSSFFSYDERLYQDFNKNIEKIVSVLDSNNFNPKVLEEDEIEVLINRFLAFDFSNSSFTINNFKVANDHIEVNDKIIKSVSLVDIDEINYPSQIKPYNNINIGYNFPEDLMSFLHRIPDCQTVVYHQVIVIPNQKKEILKLEAKKKKHSSVPDPANDLAVEDITSVLANIAKENELLVYAHYNVLFSGTQNDVARAANYLESQLFNFGVIPSNNCYNQLELFQCTFPGHTFDLKEYDKFLLTSDPAICMLFKESLQLSEDSEFKIFFADRHGIPVSIDTSDLPMRTNRINNRNKFVLGPSGSGKSFFMNHLVKQYFQQDTDIVLVDTGHSYSGLCSYYGGKYITYTEQEPITMNPFLVKKEEYNEEKREFLKSLIGLLWKGTDGSLTQVEDSVLINVVANYYKEYFQEDRDPSYLSFNSFYEFSIKEVQRIKEEESIPFDVKGYGFILKKFYKGGEYDRILNSSVDSSLFDEKFIVFEIDNIKDNKLLFPITTIIIMDVFLQKMRHKPGRKALIIEEAWKAIASPMMASYILYVYKTVRKFFGEAIVVTQELEDIISNEIVKNSIINNSDTIILLDQSKFKENYEEVSDLLSLNEIERKKIFTINNLDNKKNRGRFKEVYIKRGSKGEVYGVEVSLYEYLTYTTERKEKEALKFYINEYGGFQTGLTEFVEHLKKSELNLGQFVTEINKKQGTYYALQAV